MNRFNYVPNPMRQLGSYAQSAEDYVNDAIAKWRNQEVLSRQYDVDQTSLQDQLARLQTTHLDRLKVLTGIQDPENYVDDSDEVFGDLLATQRFFEAALDADVGGEFGIRLVRVDQARDRFRAALARMDAIAERIRIEELRQDAVATVVFETGAKIGAYELADRSLRNVPKATLNSTRCSSVPDGDSAWVSCSVRALIEIVTASRA